MHRGFLSRSGLQPILMIFLYLTLAAAQEHFCTLDRCFQRPRLLRTRMGNRHDLAD